MNKASYTPEDKIVTAGLLGLWALLILFALVSWMQPKWLMQLSNPGKDVEVSTLIQHGDELLRKNSFNAAIRNYREALKILPDNEVALGNLGIVYFNLKRYDEAISTFKYLLQRLPEKANTAHYNLAECYEKKGDIQTAAGHYTEAVKTAPNPLQGYRKIGLLQMKLKNLEKSKYYSRKALEFNSDMGSIYMAMLKSALQTIDVEHNEYGTLTELISGFDRTEMSERYDNSIFQRLLLRDREHAKNYYVLANAHALDGEYSEAADNYEAALKIWPEFSDAKKNLANVRATMK